MKIFGRSGSIKPGVYELSTRETGLGIYRTFRKGPPLVRVTFPEGWTSKQIAAVLDAKGITPAADFLAEVDKEKREGFLFPDTYFFEQGLSSEQVISRLTQRFKEKVPKDFQDRAKAMKLSYEQLVTLASIVEREARAPQERPIIAGVFYNRLRKHWYLESCATVEYSLGAWKPHLTYKDLKVDSPYNTYRHGGLPPGPICNPGAAALDAAAHPAQTDMMFFVADGQGTHNFSRYYNEHLAVQKKNGELKITLNTSNVPSINCCLLTAQCSVSACHAAVSPMMFRRASASSPATWDSCRKAPWNGLNRMKGFPSKLAITSEREKTAEWKSS